MRIVMLVIFAILYFALPIVLVGGIAWAIFKRTSFAKAVMAQARDRELVEEALGAMGRLQAEVADLQTRLDYAEHRLAEADALRPLPPASGRPRTPPEPSASPL